MDAHDIGFRFSRSLFVHSDQQSFLFLFPSHQDSGVRGRFSSDSSQQSRGVIQDFSFNRFPWTLIDVHAFAGIEEHYYKQRCVKLMQTLS